MNKLLASALLLTLTASPALRAQTILSDGFSGSNGASLNGRTPDTADLPGTTYTSMTLSPGQPEEPSINTGAGNPAPDANTGFSGNAALSIASVGAYVKPSVLNLSLDINVNDLNGGNGIGLGFFLNGPQQLSASGFSGLALNSDGSLGFYNEGTETTVAPSFTGFNPSNFYTLSYTVNTVTGAISNVFLAGNNDSAALVGQTSAGLVGAATNDVGFFGNTGDTVFHSAFVDNFEVSGVPEPSTYALLVGGAVGLLVLAYRRLLPVR